MGRALTLLRSDFKRLGIKVETVQASAVPAVMADPVLVEQVLINLLRNAADAMGQQAQAKAKARIRVQLSPAGERFVRLDVEDNGPGLGGRSVEQLAAPFYSTKTDGMGMGLAICRSVIEAHHGALEAGPSSLGGARLSFTLPVVEARP